MSHEHDHEHDAHQEPEPAHWIDIAATALLELTVEKGILSAAEIHRTIGEWEQRTPADGTRVVVRAWRDPEFKKRLLADAAKALVELGLNLPAAPHLIVLENTEQVHHLVTCTLCSCYPRQLLGFPPAWYKSRAYRARAVRDPRGLLLEFGVELPSVTALVVADSTADCRYLVLPLPPPGLESLLDEDLDRLVSRDSMIGLRLAGP